ncbi:MAG: hypothetical protein ABI167_10335 [Nitrosospira sp.]
MNGSLWFWLACLFVLAAALGLFRRELKWFCMARIMARATAAGPFYVLMHRKGQKTPPKRVKSYIGNNMA